MIIRDEAPTDRAAVRELLVAAFGSPLEADLVDHLQRDGLTIASRVAVDGATIVGHIFFSPVSIVNDEAAFEVASLAPMAVAPIRQRHGIGSALVVDGIERCRLAGWPAIVLVGHPEYYPRFGFQPAMVSHLANKFAGGDAFMGLELVPGALTNARGAIRYPPAFDELAD
jgi:putative acetyltransferase